MSKLGVISIILFSVLFAQADLSAAKEAPFSINDLAILFPMDVAKNLPKPAISISSDRWKILSQNNFKVVLKAAESKDVFLNEKLRDPKNWYLVGMRYSPCTIFYGRTNPCTEQLRYVFQPIDSVRIEEGVKGFDDYAIHVVFNFNNSLNPVRTPILDGFRKIKNQFGAPLVNKTLKPHAVLAGKQSEKYSDALEETIIKPFINNRSASVVTFMGLGKLDINRDDPHAWIFFAGQVDQQGLWQLSNLPSSHAQNFELFKILEEEESLPVNSAGFHTNIQAIPGQNQLVLGSQHDANVVLNILDMRKTNDHNVDCASCHVADREFFIRGLYGNSSEKEKFKKDLFNMFKSRKRLTEIVLNRDIQVGLKGSEFPIPRIFGYLDQTPIISQRMVQDMAISVEQANQLTGLKEVPQCPLDSQRLAFIECLYLSDSGGSVSQCLQKACF